MQQKRQIPIWFFIGALLAVYGVMIAGYGVIAWSAPPPDAMPPEIYNLHANVWWGALMLILGLFYIVKFRPSKRETLTGELDRPPDSQR